MKKTFACLSVVLLINGRGMAAEPSLTLYNQQFAVVREQVTLPVTRGISELKFSEITAHVEPESVILRDPTGQAALRVLEQNYRNDPVSQDLLLQYFEGKTIDFEVIDRDGNKSIVSGKIVRAPYVAHTQAMQRYNEQYRMAQARAYNYGGGTNTPIIEVDGKLRFSLPGLPLFPALGDEQILKPTLHWKLVSDREITAPVELSYVSGGFNWSADYNLVLPEQGQTLAMVGWVTMDNQSGRSFKDANIKLMAGEVKKIQNENVRYEAAFASSSGIRWDGDHQRVTEKSFDEYHLYTLPRKTNLLDRETKQVEFINADGIKSELVYIYNGLQIDWNRYRGWSQDSIRNEQAFGTQANKKVWVYREFENTEENNLGIPLPKGRVRFYRQDSDGKLEFVGENEIDHTPAKEKVKVYTGDAFDLVGDRQRTDYKTQNDTLTESFKITVRNRKKEPAQIKVTETLYRWPSWEMIESSDTYKKADSNTIEYLVQLAPDEEKVITYTVKYSW